MGMNRGDSEPSFGVLFQPGNVISWDATGFVPQLHSQLLAPPATQKKKTDENMRISTGMKKTQDLQRLQPPEPWTALTVTIRQMLPQQTARQVLSMSNQTVLKKHQ